MFHLITLLVKLAGNYHDIKSPKIKNKKRSFITLKSEIASSNIQAGLVHCWSPVYR